MKMAALVEPLGLERGNHAVWERRFMANMPGGLERGARAAFGAKEGMRSWLESSTPDREGADREDRVPAPNLQTSGILREGW